MLPVIVYLGVDVSKDSLDVHFLDQSHHLPNSAAGIARLLKMIAKHPGTVQIICEATGGYERAMCSALHAKKIRLTVVNPRLPRDFARSRNRLAKTDRIDARILADYGASAVPAPTPPPDPALERLALMVAQRDMLVAERAACSATLPRGTRGVPSGSKAEVSVAVAMMGRAMPPTTFPAKSAASLAVFPQVLSAADRSRACWAMSCHLLLLASDSVSRRH